MTTYLEDYIESVRLLPAELQKNFALMRELDSKSQELQRRIEEATASRLEELLQKASTGDRHAASKDADQPIERDQKACMDIADQKVSLASQTYELVDGHIRRLDRDLRKFEEELKAERDLIHGATAEQKACAFEMPRKDKDLVEPTTRVAQRKKVLSPTGTTSLSTKVSSVDIDLPVDPNEPTYCTCNQVSYGEMVACEAPDCKIEWFHFECVGLSAKPRGKWYCPDCAASHKKRTTRP